MASSYKTIRYHYGATGQQISTTMSVELTSSDGHPPESVQFHRTSSPIQQDQPEESANPPPIANKKDSETAAIKAMNPDRRTEIVEAPHISFGSVDLPTANSP